MRKLLFRFTGLFVTYSLLIHSQLAFANRERKDLIEAGKVFIALNLEEVQPKLDQNRIIFYRALEFCKNFNYDEVIRYQTEPHLSDSADFFTPIRNYEIFELKTPSLELTPRVHLRFSLLICEGNPEEIIRDNSSCHCKKCHNRECNGAR